MKQLNKYFIYIFLICFIIFGCVTTKYVKDPTGHDIAIPNLNKYKNVNLKLNILDKYKAEIGLSVEYEKKLDNLQQDYLMEVNTLNELAPMYISSGNIEKFLRRAERLEKSFGQLRILNKLLDSIKNSEEAKNDSAKLKITVDYLIKNYIDNFGNVDSEPPDFLTLSKIEELAKKQNETEGRVANLEKEVKSRIIPEENVKILIDKLSKYKGEEIKIASIIGDNEANLFAKQILTIFEKAGWVVTGVEIVIPSPETENQTIFIKDQFYQVKAVFIGNIFHLSGIDFRKIMYTNSEGMIRKGLGIYIGPK